MSLNTGAPEWGYTLNDALVWYRQPVSKAKTNKERLQKRALIAYAPEMFDALKHAVDFITDMQDSEGYPKVPQDIRNIIKKAEV